MSLTPFTLFEPGPYTCAVLSDHLMFGRNGSVTVPPVKWHLGNAAKRIAVSKILKASRKVKLLRRTGWIAHPKCMKLVNQYPIRIDDSDRVILSYRTEEYYKRMCRSNRVKKPTRKLARIFNQSNDIYMALKIAAESSLYISSEIRRLWRAIPRWVYFHPNWALDSAKLLADDLRAYGMIRRRPEYSGLIWKIFFPISRTRALQASYLKRSLPPPLKRPSDLKELEERLLQPSNSCPLEETLFHQWVDQWLNFNQPVIPRFSWPITSSKSACFEYTRQEGGLPRALKEIEIYQNQRSSLPSPLKSAYDKELDLQNKAIMECRFSRYQESPEYVQGCLRSLKILYGCLNLLERFLAHALKCPGAACTRPYLHPPVVPLLVPERGGKFREPTLTLAPITFLAKILRSFIDPFLRQDVRIRGSLTGDLRIPTGEGGFRSQDLTTATDNHSFNLTRGVFLLLEKYIPFKFAWYRSVVHLVTGPQRILSLFDRRHWHSPLWYKSEMERKPLLYRQFEGLPETEYGFIDPEPYFYKKLSDNRYLIPTHPKNLDSLLTGAGTTVYYTVHHSMSSKYEYLGTLPYGHLTKRGQMMGTSTSWPVLPLISLYAFEKSSEYNTEIISRRISVRPRVQLGTILDGSYTTKWSRGEFKFRTVRRTVPSNWRSIDTTGDDALARITPESSDIYTSILTLLGSEISSNKDFYDSHFGIYTEVITFDGYPLGLVPLAPIVAPRGVRSPSWFTQPSNISELQVRHQFNMDDALKLMYRSRYGRLYKVLQERLFPLSLPTRYGGINFPVRKPISVDTARAIEKKLSSLSASEVDRMLNIDPRCHSLSEDISDYVRNQPGGIAPFRPLPPLAVSVRGTGDVLAELRPVDNLSKRIWLSQRLCSALIKAPLSVRQTLDETEIEAPEVDFMTSISKKISYTQSYDLWKTIQNVERRPMIPASYGRMALLCRSPLGLCFPGFPTPTLSIREGWFSQEISPENLDI